MRQNIERALYGGNLFLFIGIYCMFFLVHSITNALFLSGNYIATAMYVLASIAHGTLAYQSFWCYIKND